MKLFSQEDIQGLEKVYRLNLINSISGYKSANLIGTKGVTGENLAIISSVIHLGSNPALLGFIMRPTNPERHTFRNIEETKVYTINAIHEDLIERAHYTSAKFDATTSEFEKCNIEAEYLPNCEAPFVKESRLKMQMRLEQVIPIEINDTSLIIGSVQNLYIDEESIIENGQVDLNVLKTVTISGLNRYHKATQIGAFPYAKVNELPFK